MFVSYLPDKNNGKQKRFSLTFCHSFGEKNKKIHSCLVLVVSLAMTGDSIEIVGFETSKLQVSKVGGSNET